MLAGTIVRARVYDRALDEAEVAASAATFGDYVDPAAITAALTPEVARGAHAAHERGREASVVACAAMHARLMPCRRERRARCTCRSGAIPTSPATLVAAGGVAAIVAPGADVWPAAPTHPRPGGASGWRRGSPARKIRSSRGSWSIGSGRHISDRGWSRRPAISDSTAVSPRIPNCSTGWPREMVAQGWSIKSMHRLIVTSAAYRQSSRLDAKALERDAGDRLLWRKAPTRLEAEMVRDAMLAVSGVLDPRLGGPSFRDQRYRQGSRARRPCCTRRSTRERRASTGGRFTARGLAAAGARCSTRSTAPTHRRPRPAARSRPRRCRLSRLMNNALVLYLSDAFAARLAREAGPDAGRQVERAYRLAFGRGPEPDERAWAEQRGRAIRGGHARAGDLQQQRVSLPRLNGPAGGPIMDRRDFFSWLENGLAGAAAASLLVRDGTVAGRPTGRGEPGLPSLRAQGDPRDSHLPVRGDESCRFV